MEPNHYLEFEDKFRGDRDSIIKQFHNYDKLINLTIKKFEEPKLLDIGCGRGEWLEHWCKLAPNSLGLEINRNMAQTCKSYGLNILEGDAIETIKKIEDNSISVITIFHLIEHLEYNILMELIKECNRVLNEKGLLIIETPSIDNLVVSTKSFYVDPTHINPIHPDGITFSIEKCGFYKVKYYYIHGGPLQNDDPLKLTRILNGVGQDLLILATKTEEAFQTIFSQSQEWEKDIDIGISTIDSAIDYDLESNKNVKKLNEISETTNEISETTQKNLLIINQHYAEIKPELIQLNHEIYALKEQKDNINKEIILLKQQLKYVFLLLSILKKIFRPSLRLFRSLKKIILYLSNKAFNILARYKYTRKLLSKDISVKFINFLLKNLLGSSSIINSSQIESKAIYVHKKYNNYYQEESDLYKLNNELLIHYKNSKNSNKYKDLFKKNI